MEKTEKVVVREEEASSSCSSSDNSDVQSWVTGFWRRFPWLGFGAMLMILLATIGQIAVLVVSNGTSAYQWPHMLHPNVCLSILNSISTLSITLAIGQGIAIAWWRKALSGATVKELHNGWSFGSSIASIVFNLKSFNLIALAALTAKVAVIDGVLFQRSTSTYVDFNPNFEPTSILAWASQTWPVTGIMGGDTLGEGSITPHYSNVVKSWLAHDLDFNNDIDKDIIGCNGAYCLYGLNGTGFSVACETKVETDDYVLAAPQHFATGTASNNLTLFSTQFELMAPQPGKTYSWIKMTAKRPGAGKSTFPEECPTNFTIHTCELRPALLNYTVLFQNTTSVMKTDFNHKPKPNADRTQGGIFGEDKSGFQLNYDAPDDSEDFGTYSEDWHQLAGVHVLELHDVYEPFQPGSNSSLLGVYQALDTYLGSRADLTYSNNSWLLEQSGTYAPDMMESGPETVVGCNYYYSDPLDDLLLHANKLTLIQSVYRELFLHDMGYETSSSGANVPIHNQHLDGRELFKDIFYQSNYNYMYGALAATLAVIICIMPAYWGFWQLGRKVTLGPIEIAYAFQGPALNPTHQVGGHADDVINAVGNARVQYDEVEHARGGRLRAFRMV